MMQLLKKLFQNLLAPNRPNANGTACKKYQQPCITQVKIPLKFLQEILRSLLNLSPGLLVVSSHDQFHLLVITTRGNLS